MPHLPRLLLIPPGLLHIHQVRLGVFSTQAPMRLERFNQGLAHSLRHLTRGATDIYDASSLGKRIVDGYTLLADEILDIDFLPLQ